MKKLSYFLFVFILMFILVPVASVKADTCNPDTATLGKVYVHYHRWNNDYDDVVFHTWGSGKNGTDGSVNVTSDPFGVVGEIKVNPCNADEKIGLIPHYASDGWKYKDGIDADNNNDIDNKLIDVTPIKTGKVTQMHVYVLQGSNEVIQDVEGDTFNVSLNNQQTGKLFIVYYRPNADYSDWNIWTWGTAGSETKGDDGVPFYWNQGIDGGKDPNLMKVAVFNIGSGADDQVGFIIRKPGWQAKDTKWSSDLAEDTTDELGHTYKTGGDRLINVQDIKGSGYKFVFVLQDKANFYEDYDAFKEDAFKFEFEKAEYQKIQSLSIKFNQAIEYNPEVGPEIAKFKIKDQDGKEVKIQKIGYDSKSKTGTDFTFLTDKIDVTKTYTITFNHKGLGGEQIVSKEITIADKQAPVITFRDGDSITIKQGVRKIEKPVVVVVDNIDKSLTDFVVATGKVNTAKPGKYIVTYSVEDGFGNVGTKDFTVTVESNIIAYWPVALISLGVVVVAGAVVFFVRKK